MQRWGKRKEKDMWTQGTPAVRDLVQVVTALGHEKQGESPCWCLQLLMQLKALQPQSHMRAALPSALRAPGLTAPTVLQLKHRSDSRCLRALTLNTENESHVSSFSLWVSRHQFPQPGRYLLRSTQQNTTPHAGEGPCQLLLENPPNHVPIPETGRARCHTKSSQCSAGKKPDEY